jgi:polyisoprenoid-binding protein YceI
MRKIIIAFICITCLTTISNAQEKLNIDTSKSSIKWIGEYVFSFSGHNGFINFTEGHFIKTGDVITGGEFIIDMNSITNTDIKTKRANDNLVNHLKDPDFFDAKKFPFAKLIITKVKYYDNNQVKIDANLTIKGVTNSIQFNADLDYKEKSLITKFKINRKKWNVNYKSKMKDSPISDAITFEISIKL